MAVHAHPDDESSSTGGVLARYSDEGVTTVVVTCTNGEYGDGPDHVKPGEDGHDPDRVAKTRLAELEAACQQLGVTHLETLGYHDSGMADWAFTYDSMGGYNHPDHVRAHDVAVEAFRRTAIPAKLYFIARRRRDWERLRQRMAEAGIEMPAPPSAMLTPEFLQRMEETERRITTTVDTAGVAARKREALAAHASQLDQSWWVRFPDDAFVEVFGEETFIRAEDRTGAAVPEDDLFAGLR